MSEYIGVIIPETEIQIEKINLPNLKLIFDSGQKRYTQYARLPQSSISSDRELISNGATLVAEESISRGQVLCFIDEKDGIVTCFEGVKRIDREPDIEVTHTVSLPLGGRTESGREKKIMASKKIKQKGLI